MIHHQLFGNVVAIVIGWRKHGSNGVANGTIVTNDDIFKGFDHTMLHRTGIGGLEGGIQNALATTRLQEEQALRTQPSIERHRNEGMSFGIVIIYIVTGQESSSIGHSSFQPFPAVELLPDGTEHLPYVSNPTLGAGTLIGHDSNGIVFAQYVFGQTQTNALSNVHQVVDLPLAIAFFHWILQFTTQRFQLHINGGQFAFQHPNILIVFAALVINGEINTIQHPDAEAALNDPLVNHPRCIGEEINGDFGSSLDVAVTQILDNGAVTGSDVGFLQQTFYQDTFPN